MCEEWAASCYQHSAWRKQSLLAISLYVLQSGKLLTTHVWIVSHPQCCHVCSSLSQSGENLLSADCWTWLVSMCRMCWASAPVTEARHSCPQCACIHLIWALSLLRGAPSFQRVQKLCLVSFDKAAISSGQRQRHRTQWKRVQFVKASMQTVSSATFSAAFFVGLLDGADVRDWKQSFAEHGGVCYTLGNCMPHCCTQQDRQSRAYEDRWATTAVSQHLICGMSNVWLRLASVCLSLDCTCRMFESEVTADVDGCIKSSPTTDGDCTSTAWARPITSSVGAIEYSASVTLSCCGAVLTFPPIAEACWTTESSRTKCGKFCVLWGQYTPTTHSSDSQHVLTWKKMSRPVKTLTWWYRRGCADDVIITGTVPVCVSAVWCDDDVAAVNVINSRRFTSHAVLHKKSWTVAHVQWNTFTVRTNSVQSPDVCFTYLPKRN